MTSVVEPKESLQHLEAFIDRSRTNAFKKMEVLMHECDFYQECGSDGGSFWTAYLVRMGDLVGKGKFNFERVLNIADMSFSKLEKYDDNYSRLKAEAHGNLKKIRGLGHFDVTATGADNCTSLAEWVKHATIGYALEQEDRFNRWLSHANFHNFLKNQLGNAAASPDDTLIGAFAELFELNIRLYNVDNSPMDDYASFGYRGANAHSGKEADFILLQEDADSGYRYKLLYQDADSLPRLDYNLSDTRIAFNGMNSQQGPASTGGDVACPSKPAGTVTGEDQRPLISPKEAIGNVLAEYNLIDSPEYFTKMTDISKRYRYIRRIRGDGACYWRCMMVSLFEKCIREPAYLQKLNSICSEWNEKLPELGFDKITSEDFIQVFKEEALEKISKGEGHVLLDELATSQLQLYYISFIKLITSGWIIGQGDEYLINAQADGFANVREYIDRKIQTLETPADDLAICASSNVFDLNIRIEYMTCDYRQMDQKGSYYLLPREDESADYRTFFLWRPEHYDILYKE